MKNTNFSTRTLTITAVTCFVMAVGTLVSGQYLLNKTQKVSSLNNGATTCFERVSQSFTSLMIQDFGSGYLTKSFMDTTSDCFSEASKQFSAIYAGSFKAGHKNISKLTSDLHWFNEKTQKLAKMVQDNGLSLNNSNIINKYTSLEGVKSDFQTSLEMSSQETGRWATGWHISSTVSFAGFFLTLVLFGFKQKESKTIYSKIENEAALLLENGSIVSARVDRILENVFSNLEMQNTYKLISEYHADLLEKQYKAFESDAEGFDVDGPITVTPDISIEAVADTVKMINKKPAQVADFQAAINGAVEKMQDKFFTHGIMLDTNLEDDFNIVGSAEALDQLLFNIISYATDNSLHHNTGRKITLKSKPLGGTAYLKVNIANYFFNANELNYLNGQQTGFDSINMNLLLIKEMLADAGAALAVKNKTNGTGQVESSEMELIFKRAEVAEKVTQKDIKIMKGTKKEILRAMQANA